MADYFESDKLQWEVKKLVAETTSMSRPFLWQPATWITAATLGLSLVVNAFQLHSAQLDQATIKLDTARLKLEESQLDAKLQEKKQMLMVMSGQLANQQAVLSQAKAAIAVPSITKAELAQVVLDLNQSTQALVEINGRTAQVLSRPLTAGNDFAKAREMEQKRFQALVDGKLDAAERAFQDSESAANGYHSVCEIARLLRQRRADFGDPAKQKEIVQEIVRKYSRDAPSGEMAKLRSMVQ